MASRIDLQRVYFGPSAVLGILHFGTRELFTLERPWRENAVRVSCIPDGDYRLEPHASRRFPDHYALVGGTVSHYGSVDHERSAILLHAANRVDQLLGCIAPGFKANFEDPTPRVERSRAALLALHQWIRAEQCNSIRIERGA